MFQIKPTTTAAALVSLLNNNASAGRLFTASVAGADAARTLASFAPLPTAGGAENTILAAPVTVAGITFTEAAANTLKNPVVITLDYAVFQSNKLEIKPVTDSDGGLTGVTITYKALSGATVGDLLAALRLSALVTNLFSV